MPYEPTSTTDFFKPSLSYTNTDGVKAREDSFLFEVVHVTRHPEQGHLCAVGWIRTRATGSQRRLTWIEEWQVQPGEWHLDTTTLLLATDNPVLVVRTYGWSCACQAPGLLVYSHAPSPSLAHGAADDAASAWAQGIGSKEGHPATGHHHCDDTHPYLVSSLRASPFGLPQPEPLDDEGGPTVIHVHARPTGGEPA